MKLAQHLKFLRSRVSDHERFQLENTFAAAHADLQALSKKLAEMRAELDGLNPDLTEEAVLNLEGGKPNELLVKQSAEDLDYDWQGFNDSLHGTRSGGDLHAVADQGKAGFMSAVDKSKLDGIESGATAVVVTDDAAEEISDGSPAVGTSPEAARADHVHPHGERGGGSLHAMATGSAPGFMSASDKTAINALDDFAFVAFDDPVTIPGNWTFAQPITVPAASIPGAALADDAVTPAKASVANTDIVFGPHLTNVIGTGASSFLRASTATGQFGRVLISYDTGIPANGSNFAGIRFGQLVTESYGDATITFGKIQILGAVSLFARTATSAGVGGNFTIGTQSLPIRRGTGALESHQFPANSALIRSGTGLVTATAAANDTVQGRDGSGSLGWIKVALQHLATSLLNILFRGTITTNANGTSIRFQLGSLGVQLCHHSLNLGSRVTFGAGTYADPWRSGTTNWTFPQAFDSAPHFAGVGIIDDSSAQTRANSVFARSVSSTGVTAIQSVACSSDATAIDAIAHVWAIGTWTP